MTIPIRNLYYLFLYAWDRFPAGAMGNVGVDESPDLPNLFAKLLLTGTHSLFRRGLDRGYKTFTGELTGPRGRLRLDRVIKETKGRGDAAICDFDELTHDVLHNQILKATLKSLAGCADVDKRARHDLKCEERRFDGVTDIRLTGSCFIRTVVSRNNREYSFLLKLCEFVFQSLMPDSQGTKSRFRRVLQDEAYMSAVFEQFLRNFFKIHRLEYVVKAQSHQWNVSDTTHADLAFLPRMVTDITLTNSTHTIIADAKYYEKPLVERFDAERVRSPHLYQMLAYLQHEKARHPDRGLAGMLIYAEAGRKLRLRYRIFGIPLLVATVDLAQPWKEIERTLNSLLDEAKTGISEYFIDPFRAAEVLA